MDYVPKIERIASSLKSLKWEPAFDASQKTNRVDVLLAIPTFEKIQSEETFQSYVYRTAWIEHQNELHQARFETEELGYYEISDVDWFCVIE